MSEGINREEDRQRDLSLSLSAVLDLTAASDVSSVYRWGIDMLDRHLEADVVSMAETNDNLLVPVASTLASRTGREHALPIETSLPGSAVLSGDGCLVRDRHDVRGVAPTLSNGDVPASGGTGYRSVVCAPVPESGVLIAQAREPERFDEEDLEVAITVGQIVANIVEGMDGDPHTEPLLEEIGSMMSHDLRNKVNIAMGRLDLALRTDEDEHLHRGIEALETVERIADVVVSLAQTGDPLSALEPVDLEQAVTEVFQPLEHGDMELAVKASATILADPNCLGQLLENLLRNAIEHHEGSGIIEVGLLEDGFYISDDGPGIPEEIREDVLKLGYSTSAGNQGKGLTIVTRMADAHEWGVHITDSTMGGTRIEIRDVVFH